MNLVAVKGKIKKNKSLIPWALLVLACLFIFYLLFFSNRNSLADDKQKEAQITIDAVRKILINLPDEVPTLATITDLSKLKGIPLFQNAKMGDKVLFYTKALKAIIYDPKLNVIVDIGRLGTSSSQGTSSIK